MEIIDPFHHHPELRDKIVEPPTSFFRNLNIELLEQLFKEHNLPGGWWYSDQEREALRAAFMTDRFGRDLWVFGYGSLMWDPAFDFAEVRRARIDGYSRQFILKDVRGGRGNHDQPGLFAALDDGPGCDGLAFRIAADHLEEATALLWQREQIEPGYLPVIVRTHLDDCEVEALTFVADHSAEVIAPGLPHNTQVEYIATASGILGTSAEYLGGIVAKLRELGIEDAETAELWAGVEAYCAAKPG